MRLSLIHEITAAGAVAMGPDRSFFEGKYGRDSKRPMKQVWQPEKTGGMPKDTSWAIPKSITKNPPYGKIYHGGGNPSNVLKSDGGIKK